MRSVLRKRCRATGRCETDKDGFTVVRMCVCRTCADARAQVDRSNNPKKKRKGEKKKNYDQPIIVSGSRTYDSGKVPNQKADGNLSDGRKSQGKRATYTHRLRTVGPQSHREVGMSTETFDPDGDKPHLSSSPPKVLFY